MQGISLYDWDMEQIEGRVRQLIEEGARRLEAETELDRDFRQKVWPAKRDEIVRPVLEAVASTAQRTAFGTAHVDAGENDKIKLEVYKSLPSQTPSAVLSFFPDYKSRVIVCSAHGVAKMEEHRYAPEGFTLGAAEHCVTLFVRALIASRIERRGQ